MSDERPQPKPKAAKEPEGEKIPETGNPAPAPAPDSHPIRDLVEKRANDLLIRKRQGMRLSSGQKNLVDFWLVDSVRRVPTESQCAEILDAAEG